MKISSNGIFNGFEFSEVGPTLGLVGYWKLDGSLKDLSGNGNDLVNDGQTIASGINQSQYEFDGTGTTDGTVEGSNLHISSDITNTSLTNYPYGCTYSVWIYVDSDAVDRMCLFRGGQTTNHIEIYTEGKYFRTEAAQQNGYSFGTSSFPDSIRGQWQHFIIVFANNETNRPVRWYQNGSLFHTGNMTGGTNPDTEYFSFGSIGQSTGTTSYLYQKSFDGKIQDLRIYDRPLSEQEIKILYDMTMQNNMKMTEDTIYIKNQLIEN